jgi:probable phosphoglycerate mutase
MNNVYFILRHGESVPNTRGIILSNLNEGEKEEYTLTPRGEEQVGESVREAKERALLDAGTIIYSSPFSRCKRTAEIARDVLGVKTEIILDDRLRERWFGNWEGTSNENYQKVWDKDITGANHRDAGVESTGEIATRVSALIKDIEAAYFSKNILLVSHGDALQILQTVFENVPSSKHRGIEHFKVAEIRRIN